MLNCRFKSPSCLNGLPRLSLDASHYSISSNPSAAFFGSTKSASRRISSITGMNGAPVQKHSGEYVAKNEASLLLRAELRTSRCLFSLCDNSLTLYQLSYKRWLRESGESKHRQLLSGRQQNFPVFAILQTPSVGCFSICPSVLPHCLQLRPFNLKIYILSSNAIRHGSAQQHVPADSLCMKWV